LADTLEDIADAMNHALTLQGFHVQPVLAYRALIGGGIENLARRAAGTSLEPQRCQELVREFRAHYAKNYVRKTVPYPGIHELLNALTVRDVPLAVLSNKLDVATRTIVEALFPGRPFRVVYGERQGVPRKPDPQAALEIASLLGVPPRACIYVGDSEIDVQTATRAGMQSVSVLWGFRDRQELEAHGARTFIREPRELLAVLDASAGREES
jgi:phosphoglycolate phosphatase